MLENSKRMRRLLLQVFASLAVVGVGAAVIGISAARQNDVITHEPVRLDDLLIGQRQVHRVHVPVPRGAGTGPFTARTTCGCAAVQGEPVLDSAGEVIACTIVTMPGPYEAAVKAWLILNCGGKTSRTPIVAETVPPVAGWPAYADAREVQGAITIAVEPRYLALIHSVECYGPEGEAVPVHLDAAAAKVVVQGVGNSGDLELVLVVIGQRERARWAAPIQVQESP